jgi:hypothetical protein
VGVFRLDDDGAEQAGVDLSAVPFAAGRGAQAVDHVLAFTVGIENVGGVFADIGEAVGIRADKRTVVVDALDELHADGVDGRPPGGGLLLVDLAGAQQVLEVDDQAVADVHPQHHWAGALAGPELDRARPQLSRAGIGRHHVAAQGEHHPLRLHGAEAIPEEHLVEGDYVGVDLSRAGPVLRGGWAWQGEQHDSETFGQEAGKAELLVSHRSSF